MVFEELHGDVPCLDEGNGSMMEATGHGDLEGKKMTEPELRRKGDRVHYSVTMPGKVYSAALETSDWLSDNDARVVRVMRRGTGYSYEIELPTSVAYVALAWHVSELADSLASVPGAAGDVRAMRKWLSMNGSR
jgi:hypothetical protein